MGAVAPSDEEQATTTLQPSVPVEDLDKTSISVSMTLNIDYQQLSTDDKVQFKDKIRDVLADSASVDQAAVSVTLTPGSVKVDAEIKTSNANSAKSLEESMSKTNVAENV